MVLLVARWASNARRWPTDAVSRVRAGLSGEAAATGSGAAAALVLVTGWGAGGRLWIVRTCWQLLGAVGAGLHQRCLGRVADIRRSGGLPGSDVDGHEAREGDVLRSRHDRLDGSCR